MKLPFITALFSGKSTRLAAEVAVLKDANARLENLLAERGKLIEELRAALDAPRRAPFLSVGDHGGGSGETSYEQANPTWL